MGLLARGASALPRLLLRREMRRSAEKAGVTCETISEEITTMMHALFERQSSGLSTSLRQLHLITDFDQPNALRLYAEMQAADWVAPEHCLHDELETTIVLTERGLARLAK